MTIQYKVFEDEDGVRYLSPSSNIINKILNQNKQLQENNKLKTSKSIQYLVTSTDGNNLFLTDVSSFNQSIESLLEESNPVLIKTEKHLKHLLSIGCSFSFNNNSENKLEPIPIPIDKVNPSKEEKYLKKYLNYYLKNLGLKQIKNIEQYEVYKLATKGDILIALEIFNKFSQKGAELSLINSNKVQQFALASLGFKEFLFVPEHLAGTFFEAIFCLADYFNKQELKNEMLLFLTNHLSTTSNFEFPVFED